MTVHLLQVYNIMPQKSTFRISIVDPYLYSKIGNNQETKTDVHNYNVFKHIFIMFKP